MSSELGVERPTTLPLPETQEERHVHFGEVSRCLISNEEKSSVNPYSRDSEFRPKRLRSASFSAGEFRYGNKRRKRYRVLPSKFLLGGNITDPLNLGSLEDREEISQLSLVEASVGTGTAAGVTNKKSDAVRVIIPPNINDPLNLDVSSENEDSLNDALQRQLRKRKRYRKRKRRLSEPTGDNVECEPLPTEGLNDSFQSVDNEAQPETPVSETEPKISQDKPALKPLNLNPLTVNTELPAPSGGPDDHRDASGQTTPVGTKPSTSGFQRPAFKKQRQKSDNKIVSPVIPQPGVERKRHPSHSRQYLEKPHLSQQNLKLPKSFKPRNEHFQYGNYTKYYGYRNPDMSADVRLDYFKPEWFHGKDVLDVGCNIGHITLTIARDFHPKKVVGIDIDKKLVKIAQTNIKHYRKKGDEQESRFPKSMRLLYGPLKPPVSAADVHSFPHNIKFVHANYVMESDDLLETVRPEFDVIMCLSITKWIQLNWGDAGLKRFFRRVFNNLNPGGKFILEPQSWSSYNKRRKLTMQIFENYKSIRLFPDKFNDYLLHEVGFSTSEKMTPHHRSRGFQRPIIVYTKAANTAKSILKMDDKIHKNICTKVETNQKSPSSESTMNTSSIDGSTRVTEGVNEMGRERAEEKVMDTASNKSESVNMSSAQCFNSTSKGPVTIANEGETDAAKSDDNEKTEAMDCDSNSQCGDRKIDANEHGLVSEKEAKSRVCDNNSNFKKTGDEGNTKSLLTHSLDHKPNECTSESHLFALTKDSNDSESCTKGEVVPKTHTNPAMGASNEHLENKRFDVSDASNSEVQRTPSEMTCTSDGSSALTVTVSEVQDNSCGISKEVTDKASTATSTTHEGLLSVTKPRSPSVSKTEHRP